MANTRSRLAPKEGALPFLYPEERTPLAGGTKKRPIFHLAPNHRNSHLVRLASPARDKEWRGRQKAIIAVLGEDERVCSLYSRYVCSLDLAHLDKHTVGVALHSSLGNGLLALNLSPFLIPPLKLGEAERRMDVWRLRRGGARLKTKL